MSKNSLVKDPEIRVGFYILLNSLPEGHNCQTKSGHHTEKEIGKTLGKIHLLLTLLNLCPLYKGLHQNLQIQHLQNLIHESKEKLQTPAVTPRKIQPPVWKKNRVESPSNPSYHYTPGSTINISSTNTFPSTATSAFGQFLFQSRQRKTELLGPYSEYFEGFNSRSSTPSELQLPPPPPDFRISDPWKAAESEKKKEESENQEFTYQCPITENLEVETPNFQIQQNPDLENSEIKTPNHQKQNNPNSELSNQQNLSPIIVISQSPINPIAESIQQPLQLPPQQPVQQQLFQQPPQPPNLDPMAYAPITKLDNFTGEEDDAQVWLNDVEKAIAANGWNDARAMQAIPYFLKDTTNSWYQSLINKPQDFNAFKAEFLRYFSNNNSINRLVNTFTIMKQGKTEAVTTYLGHFHQNLHQIQAIDANYFTAPQILNQFIRGLCSSILQHVHPLYPGTLQDAVTCTRDFESTESEANHAQAINLVMNGSSELDSKLEKFSKSINKRLEGYLVDNYAIYQSLQQCNNQGNSNYAQNQPRPSSSTNQQWQQEMCICHYCVYQAPIYQPQPQVIYQQLQSQIIYQPQQIQTLPQSLPPNGTQRPRMTQQSWRSAMVVHQLISHSSQQSSGLRQWNLGTSQTQNPNSQNYLSLLVTPEDALTNNPTFAQKQPLTSNIPFATITENKFLAAIFPFEFKKTAATPLFSGAALEAKPITTISSAGSIITWQLMNQLGHRVDRAASARIITANGVTKTPISKIDDFPFKVNGIMTPIKVLVMKAIQYQALIGNDWLFKVNATLDWNTQELQLTYQGYTHICIGYRNLPGKPTKCHNNDNGKGKQKKELTWETDDLTWTDNDENELISSWEWEENKKEKGKGKEREEENTQANNTYIPHTYG
ncbi:hypothetical protein G9A89_021065 [Geosiphon pyriformis]|nr:hypothetical protein G9A89_021065 [Geosiphon pyriformis]